MARLKRTTRENESGRAVSADPRPADRLDPRWILSPHAGRIASHMYLLMTGDHPPGRVHGWVSLARGDVPTVDDVWREHGPGLIAVAEAHDFKAWKVTGTTPSGDGFERWAAAFLKAHTY